MSRFSYALPYDSRRAPVFGRRIVSTSQPLASQAGLQTMLAGGNAVDAALAAAIALTVLEPNNNGLGSDAFAIVWDGKELHGLNASGRSPRGWTPERFAGLAKMPQRGWESVTVPGAVAGWAALSKRFGKLPFEALFAHAIGFARDGFHVTPEIGGRWAAGLKQLGDQPGFRDCFSIDGRAPAVGEVFVNRPIAETLERIAASGGDDLYCGESARRIAAWSRQHGGALDEQDLAEHQVDWVGTLSQRFRDVELNEIPPNGQGIVALMALGMLEHMEIDGLDPDGAAAIHLQVEALKLAFADVERFVGDPAHMEVGAAELLDADYLRRRAAQIDPKRAQVAAAGAPKQGGTVYLTAADAEGMMVSYIQSNYGGFGSGVVVPGTGIHLQNRGFGFVLEEGHANRVGPAKRPFHTIIPGFLMKDGRPQMSLGVMGGPVQAQGHVQMVLRTQLFGQNPQAAVDAPRWRFNEGLNLAVESSLPEAAVAELLELGHKVSREPPAGSFGFGGAQLIHVLEDGYVAGSDSRKDGAAVAL